MLQALVEDDSLGQTCRTRVWYSYHTSVALVPVCRKLWQCYDKAHVSQFPALSSVHFFEEASVLCVYNSVCRVAGLVSTTIFILYMFSRNISVNSDGKIAGSKRLYCNIVILFLTKLSNCSTDIFGLIVVKLVILKMLADQPTYISQHIVGYKRYS